MNEFGSRWHLPSRLHSHTKQSLQHGRLKVRTSEEEEQQRKLKQEAKLKVYIPCLERIFAKRKANELDNELITLTGNILISNPDFYTLWNVRKQCFLTALESPEDRDLVDMFNRDLDFTEGCLRTNPKSYGAWHHRCWLLENHPQSDNAKEVALCTRYLKLDERNFHCWDYRRYVVSRAGVKPEDELQFCTEKIEQNFSNYSSWHYRSKLLPLLYPNEDATRKGWPICEEKLKSELELVLTAAFTDPKDSSAWFYQRWLLGYYDKEQEITCAFVSKERAILSFAKPVRFHEESFALEMGVPELNDKSLWKSANGLTTDHIWYTEPVNSFQVPSTTMSLEVSVKVDAAKLSLTIKRDAEDFFALAQKTSFAGILSQPITDELKSQLESCEQLLEFEPDSKWTLLTAALLMRAIDQNAHHQQMTANLEKLKVVDSLRVGYYSDLINKWNIERVLLQWLAQGDINAPVDFSSCDLTCLYYEQYFAVAKRIRFGGDVLPPRIAKRMAIFKNLM